MDKNSQILFCTCFNFILISFAANRFVMMDKINLSSVDRSCCFYDRQHDGQKQQLELQMRRHAPIERYKVMALAAAVITRCSSAMTAGRDTGIVQRRKRRCQRRCTRTITQTIAVVTATSLLAIVASAFTNSAISVKTTRKGTAHKFKPSGSLCIPYSGTSSLPKSHLIVFVSALNGARRATDVVCYDATTAATTIVSSPEDPAAQPQEAHESQQLKSTSITTSHRRINVVRVQMPFRRTRSSRVSTTPSTTASLDSTTIDEAPSSASRRTKRMRRIPEHMKRSPDEDEFDWLHWVYHQWRNTPPGQLNEYLMSQMSASIPKWARRRTLQSAHYAEQALERLIQEAEAHVDVQRDSSSNDHQRPRDDIDKLPVSTYLTLVSFNSAMDAYGKIGRPDGVQRILRRMESLQQSEDERGNILSSHFSHLRPDEFSMCTLATAWAKSRAPDAADQVEAMLRFMELKQIRINTNVYNAVIHAIAISHDTDKALRAEDIVKSMIERSEKDGQNCYPDVYTFQSLIQAWAYSPVGGAPQRCEQILRRMDDEAEKTKNKSLMPNIYCYTTLIHAWARSNEHGRARNASRLLNEVYERWNESGKSKRFKPNVKTFTATLNACARPAVESEKRDAFEIGKQTMDKLATGIHGRPNFLSYAAFLSVCESTLEPGIERDAIVKKTFEKCARDQMVCETVLRKLFSAASPSLLDSLVGAYNDGDGNIVLPDSWSSNVHGERSVGRVAQSRRIHAPISESSHHRLKAIGELSYDSMPNGIWDLAWKDKPLPARRIPGT